MPSMLEEWRDALRRNLSRPPRFVLADRLGEYRLHVAAALALVERALAHRAATGRPLLDRDVLDEHWEPIREHMQAAACCAFPGPMPAVEAPPDDPVSCVRPVAERADLPADASLAEPPAPPPNSLRKIIAFIKKAANA
jgi:hypothetical protein